MQLQGKQISYERPEEVKLNLLCVARTAAPVSRGGTQEQTARGRVEAQVAFSKHCSHPRACCCCRHSTQNTKDPPHLQTCPVFQRDLFQAQDKSVTRSTNSTLKSITDTVITSTYLKSHLKLQVLKNLMSCPLLAIKAEISFFTNFVKLSLLDHFSSV